MADDNHAEPMLRCFLLSPIGEEGSDLRIQADKVMRHLVKKALPNFDVTRADDDRNPGAITPRIISGILESDLIIADMSTSNPNVFYEMAVAHGYRKPTVHIQEREERVPFDVKDMRIIKYSIADPDELEKAQRLLADYAKFAVKDGSKIETPLSSAERFETVRSSQDPVAESNVQLLDALNDLRRDVLKAVRGDSADADHDADAVGENMRSLVRIVNRVVTSGRCAADDFAAAITPTTSTEFDEWVKKSVKQLDPGLNDDELADLIFREDVE